MSSGNSHVGSTYKVNGKVVRMRDVQLLFADSSIGSHSPGLVSQGRVADMTVAAVVPPRDIGVSIVPVVVAQVPAGVGAQDQRYDAIHKRRQHKQRQYPFPQRVAGRREHVISYIVRFRSLHIGMIVSLL